MNVVITKYVLKIIGSKTPGLSVAHSPVKKVARLYNILRLGRPVQTINPVISSPAPGSSLECG
ncbi:hypothetical protein M8369_35220, partial [Klebsiella pneumoniae]|nr:hypothetical protein [Klebsiella pneumoniae]